MTPEQKIFSQLKSAFTKSLPKGRWMLQRIETSTGTGIHDVYCSILIGDRSTKLWLETKTTEYEVTNEQLNWADLMWKAGTPSFIVTLAAMPQNAGQTAPFNGPYATLAWLTATSNHATHANPCLTNPDVTATHRSTSDLSQLNSPHNRQQTASGQNKAPVKKTRPGPDLILLAFDERMRDCSSLGVYLRRFNPPALLVCDWLALVRRTADLRSQPI